MAGNFQREKKSGHQETHLKQTYYYYFNILLREWLKTKCREFDVDQVINDHSVRRLQARSKFIHEKSNTQLTDRNIENA